MPPSLTDPIVPAVTGSTSQTDPIVPVVTGEPSLPEQLGHLVTRGEVRDIAYAAAARVLDPEMPMLTLADLGVLRDVEVGADRHVTVSITPTYSGCPAMASMRDDLVRTLADAGLTATVKVVLSPPWSSDDITPAGRAALAAHGLSAPGPATRHTGPIALNLKPIRRSLACPRCGSADSQLTSEFGPTACTALYRCGACGEPFEHVKEI